MSLFQAAHSGQKPAALAKSVQTFPSFSGHLNSSDKGPVELCIPVPGQQSVIPVSQEARDSKSCVLRASEAMLGLEGLAEGETYKGNPGGRGDDS